MLQERRSKLVQSRSATAEPPAATRAGAELKAARERLGMSIDDVARNLRIRVFYLESLEEGRIASLPGNAYALAFVRTYAGALGLDAKEMVRRFKTEAATFNRSTELVFPVPMAEHGLPAGAVLLLALVLAIGSYAAWYRLSGEGRLPAETVAAIPERLASLAEQALPPPPNPVASRPAPNAPASATADAAAGNGPRIVLAEPATPDTQTNPAPPPPVAISPSSAAAAQLPWGTFAEPPAPVSTDGRIVLRANAEAWIMVKDHGGAILLNRTLKAGENWPVPPRSDLLLTVGNAGGTEILVDGSMTPTLGASGTVRRDLPLDPDQIKDGKLAGAAMPQLASGRTRQ